MISRFPNFAEYLLNQDFYQINGLTKAAVNLREIAERLCLLALLTL